MTTYLPPVFRALVWGFLLTALLRHSGTSANPFLDLLLHLLVAVAVLVQLVLLRRKGLLYLAVFLGSLLLFTSLLGMLDSLLIHPPRRYYSVQ